jgi:hypothetical protein
MFDRNGVPMDPAGDPTEDSFPVTVKVQVPEEESIETSLSSGQPVDQAAQEISVAADVSEAPVCTSTEAKTADDIEPLVSTEIEANATDDSIAPVCAGTEATATDDSKPPECTDTEAKTTDDSNPLVSTAIEAKLTDDSTAPISTETEAKATEDSKPSVCTETEAKVDIHQSTAAVGEEEEESEWETEEETDDEIFKRANPDRGLRQRNQTADPWQNMFKWIVAVVKHRQAADQVPKVLSTLVGPDDMDPATLKTESLCDGKILCALMIALQPKALGKLIPNAMGRLSQVVKACKQFGVRDSDLFGVPDIINAPPQNSNAVLRCLTALAGIVATWEEYSGPKLRKSR